MTKATVADTTLSELWAIKDETATRFKSVSEYFAHLKAEAAPASRRNRVHQTTPTVSTKRISIRGKSARVA